MGLPWGFLGAPAPRFASFSFGLGHKHILVSLESTLKSSENPRQLNLEAHWDNTHGFKWQNHTFIN